MNIVRWIVQRFVELLRILKAPLEAAQGLFSITSPSRGWVQISLLILLLGWVLGWPYPRTDYYFAVACIASLLCSLDSMRRNANSTKASLAEIQERFEREFEEIHEMQEQFVREIHEIRQMQEANGERTQRVRHAVMEIGPQVADMQRRLEHTEFVLASHEKCQ